MRKVKFRKAKYIFIAILILICVLYVKILCIDGLLLDESSKYINAIYKELALVDKKAKIYGDVRLFLRLKPRIHIQSIDIKKDNHFHANLSNVEIEIKMIDFLLLRAKYQMDKIWIKSIYLIDQSNFNLMKDGLILDNLLKYLRFVEQAYFQIAEYPEMQIRIGNVSFESQVFQMQNIKLDRAWYALNFKTSILDSKSGLLSDIDFKVEDSKFIANLDLKSTKNNLSMKLNGDFNNKFENLNGSIFFQQEKTKENIQNSDDDIYVEGQIDLKSQGNILLFKSREDADFKINGSLKFAKEKIQNVNVDIHWPLLQLLSYFENSQQIILNISKYFDYMPYVALDNLSIKVDKMTLSKEVINNFALSLVRNTKAKRDNLHCDNLSFETSSSVFQSRFDIDKKDTNFHQLSGVFALKTDFNKNLLAGLHLDSILDFASFAKNFQKSQRAVITGSVMLMPNRFDIKNGIWDLGNASIRFNNSLFYGNKLYRIIDVDLRGFDVMHLLLPDHMQSFVRKLLVSDSDKSCLSYIKAYDGFKFFRDIYANTDMYIKMSDISYDKMRLSLNCDLSFNSEKVLVNNFAISSPIGALLVDGEISIDKMRPKIKFRAISENVDASKIGRILKKLRDSSDALTVSKNPKAENLESEKVEKIFNFYSSACHDISFISKIKSFQNSPELQDISLDGSIQSGNISFKNININAFGGVISGDSLVQVFDAVPSFYVGAKLRNIDILPTLSNILNIPNIDGKYTMDIRANTKGRTMDALKRAINAQVIFKATDVQIKGANLQNIAYIVSTNLNTDIKRNVIDQSLRGGETNFNKVSGAMSVNNGVGNLTKCELSEYRIQGAALANIAFYDNALAFAARFAWRALDDNRELNIVSNISRDANSQDLKVKWNIDDVSAYITEKANAQKPDLHKRTLHEELNSKQNQ